MTRPPTGSSAIADPLSVWARATDRWLRFYGGVTRDAVERSRAATVAYGGAWPDDDGPAPALPSMGYRERDWQVERSVESRDHIAVGDTVTFSKRLTGDDVRAFARASGDTNRLHLDRSFAERTRFGERIVHGTLVSGLISAALARLPGLTVYLSQETTYLAAVPIGERVSAHCEVVEALGDDRYRLSTVVTDASGETVVDGEALVLVDPLPTTDDR